MGANLYAALHRAFAPALDGTFLRLVDGAELTYRDVDELSARFAGALADAGVERDDRVMVQVAKSPENVALYFAVLRMGAVYVPLNTAYSDEEVAYFLTDAEPALTVADPSRPPPDAPHLTLDGAGKGSLIEAAAAASPVVGIVESEPDDLAAMLYTSGTTGRPKGAMLTHDCLISNARALHEVWAFEPGDVLLHVLPLFHAHGLMIALHPAVLNASPVILVPRFDAETVIEHLPAATVMMGVPTHYSRLLRHEGFDRVRTEGVRLLTSGSAPMPSSLHEQVAARIGHEIVERYGMTETGVITSNPWLGERVPGTVGFALPGVEVRVGPHTDAAADADRTGVVEVRGPNVCAGYWRRPEASAECFTADGFFVTGDVGRIDPDGRLTLEGRSSDMIISGGLNVYPREIEALVSDWPGVAECAVVGLPHPDLGEAVTAFLVVEGDEEPPTDRLAQSLDGRLARFKHPKRYLTVPALPRNAMGKVMKDALRSGHSDLYET